MKTPRQSRFDVAVLRAQAGAKVFARGEAYRRDGLPIYVAGLEDRHRLKRNFIKLLG